MIQVSEDGERVITLEEQVKANQRKEDRWKRVGRGRGNRWLMLRDLLSILSLRPMTMNLIQDTMFLHKGLKRSTVREMIDQLERTNSIEQLKDTVSSSVSQWVWVATEGGVQYWIENRLAIPASIVKVAWTMKSVNPLGE